MATTYKTFLDDDIKTVKTLLHENIPLTASIIESQLYAGQNIKQYSHGMFESVYDYPYESSSANQLFDMTIGIAKESSTNNNLDSFKTKKNNMYNQMAQVLVGYDSTGSIYKFDRDGDQSSGLSDDKYYSAFILNFNRLLVKDEIRKGSFKLTLGVNDDYDNPFLKTCIVSDVSSSDQGGYRTNSPTGEYAILYASGSGLNTFQHDKEVGLIFYQAGVVILSTNVFAASGSQHVTASAFSNKQGQLSVACDMGSGFANVQELFASGSIDDANEALRNRIANLTFNNTTELNSTVHFCRIHSNEFNYSSNPTYLQDSKIRVKSKATDSPVSYITTVGLYSADNELLAVAKLSQPIKKTPTEELILRVRLDY